MRNFKISKHAAERMKQRHIPDPNTLELVIAKNKHKKQIKKQCPENGYRKDLIYWRENNKHELNCCFVCSVSGVGEYTVITAFRLFNNVKK